ncbi:MAG: hypothetical protein U5J63_07810 [Fodinibius sp.]|nr:hypothetical protein [Fodinibius sp.]
MDLFKKEFAPQKMGAPLQKTFQEQYNTNHAQTTAQRLNKTTIQQVLDFEKEFYTMQGIRKRVVNRYEIEKNPPSQQRTQLVDSVAQAMELAEMEVEARATIFRAMVTALSELSEQRNFSEMQTNRFVDNFRNQVRTQINQQLTDRLLLKYHGLENEPLKQYISFYQSPAGQWLSSTRTQAVHNALDQAANQFMDKLSTIK